jgi:hypothetical protein
MKQLEIVDARGGDHVIAQGKVLKKVILERIAKYRDAYNAILTRMNNELPSKEAAIPLMVALTVEDTAVNEQTLFFKACIERARWLDAEIRALNTLGQTFVDEVTYRITVKDAARFGV